MKRQKFLSMLIRALASLSLAAAASAMAQQSSTGSKLEVHGQDYARVDVDKRVLTAEKFNWPEYFPGESEVGVFRLPPDTADGCPHGVFVMSLGNPAKKKDWDDVVAAKSNGKLVEIQSNQKGHKYKNQPCIVKNLKVK